jgi:hypothetical protein
MPTLSIVTITLNEETTLPWLLNCCKIVKYHLKEDLKEIVIADGGSIDGTLRVIEEYSKDLPIVLIEHPFDTWGEQRNRTLSACTGDYIFGPDADMTWTKDFAPNFESGAFNSCDFWNLPVYFTIQNRYHYFEASSHGASLRLWKRGPRFTTNFHERLEGQPVCPPCAPVSPIIFENSLLLSDEALLDRGKRLQKFTQQLSASGCGPGGETRYVDAKNNALKSAQELPADILNRI